MPSNNIKHFIPLGGAIIFAGAAGYIFYKLYQKDEDELEQNKNDNDFSITPVSKEEIKIPNSAIAIIIGRNGRTMKTIQSSTCTIIDILDFSEKNGDRSCFISGKVENIEEAKQWILRIIKDIPVLESENIYVPRNCIGKIIGRNGENINAMSSETSTRIKIPDSRNTILPERPNDRLICIKGSKQGIESAKKLIQETVEECIETRNQIQKSAAGISHRNSLNNGTSYSQLDTNNCTDHNVPVPVSAPQICSENSEREVHVSGMESPAHFWVQISDSTTIALFDLIKQMNEYYYEQTNRDIHKLTTITDGQIVAALYPKDLLWYRGRIVYNSEKENPDQVPVFFLDFGGDTDIVSRENIVSLRTDFLTLNFQAIECYLADIDPESIADGCGDAFLSMTYPPNLVTMDIVSYNESQIPFVKLISSNEDNDKEEKLFDIATALVNRGLASWKEGKNHIPNGVNQLLVEPLPSPV